MGDGTAAADGGGGRRRRRARTHPLVLERAISQGERRDAVDFLLPQHVQQHLERGQVVHAGVEVDDERGLVRLELPDHVLEPPVRQVLPPRGDRHVHLVVHGRHAAAKGVGPNLGASTLGPRRGGRSPQPRPRAAGAAMLRWPIGCELAVVWPSKEPELRDRWAVSFHLDFRDSEPLLRCPVTTSSDLRAPASNSPQHGNDGPQTSGAAAAGDRRGARPGGLLPETAFAALRSAAGPGLRLGTSPTPRQRATTAPRTPLARSPPCPTPPSAHRPTGTRGARRPRQETAGPARAVAPPATPRRLGGGEQRKR